MCQMYDILDNLESFLNAVKKDDQDTLNKFVRVKIDDFRKLLDNDKNYYMLECNLYKLTNPLSFLLTELYRKYYDSKRLQKKIKKIDDDLYLIFHDCKSTVYYNWLQSPKTDNGSSDSDNDNND